MSDMDRLYQDADEITVKVRELTGPASEFLTQDERNKLARMLRWRIYRLGEDLCNNFGLRWVGWVGGAE